MIRSLFRFLWLYSALLGLVAVYVAWKFNWPPHNSHDWMYFLLLAAVGLGLAFLSVWEFLASRKSLHVSAEGVKINAQERIPWVMIRDIVIHTKPGPQTAEVPAIFIFRFDNDSPAIYVIDERHDSVKGLQQKLQQAAPVHLVIRVQH
jgi:hypothetical protein